MNTFDGDSLDDLFTPSTPANPAAPAPRKCYRHTWFQVRRIRGRQLESDGFVCSRCGKRRDEEAVKRNKNNRARGSAFERKVAQQLGGRKTGPLGGRDDVMVGTFAAVQTKKTLRFSLSEARTYLADLRRTFPDRVPLVVHALPGHNADPVVILPLDVWRDLHQNEGDKP